MVHYLRKISRNKDPHCHTNDIVNFYVMSSQTGYTITLKNGVKKSNQYKGLWFSHIYVCCKEDFIFYSTNESVIVNPLETVVHLIATCSSIH